MIPEDKACQIVNELGKNGCFYFSISGGEPLTVPYLENVLSEAKRSGICYTHLVTNGMLLAPERVQSLVESQLDEISLSLDGPQAEHDRRRGVDGAYEGVMCAINNMKSIAPNIDIVLNTILSPENPDNCLYAIMKAEELDLNIKIQPYNKHPDFGVAENASYDERVCVERNSDELKSVIEYGLKSRVVVNSKAFLRGMRAYFYSKDMPLDNERCMFGCHHVEVSEDGCIYPCLEGMDWKGGFEVNGSMREIIDGSEYTKLLSELRSCKHCSRTMYVCYYEPRLSFPLGNFLKHVIS